MGWFADSARSQAEVEAEIAAEIEFHLEQRTRELAEQGLGTEEARAEAERRFGSVERVRRSCRSIQLGERIMLQRIQLALNVVLATAVVVLGWSFRRSNAELQDKLNALSTQFTPRTVEASAPDPLLERFRALKDVSGAGALGSELACADSEKSWEVLEAGWPLVSDWNQRVALIEPFLADGGHAHAVAVLHLAATDTDERVRAEAFRHLMSYAWQDFGGKPSSLYREWYQRVAGQRVVDVLNTSVMEYQKRLGLLRGAALIRELGLLERIDLTPGSLRGYDALNDLWLVSEDNARSFAERWFATDDAELQLAALRFVAHFQLQEDFTDLYVVNALSAYAWKSVPHTLAACNVLARSGQIPLEAHSWLTIRLLRLCVEQDSPEIRQTIGACVLARLWRLPPDPTRGSAQWLAWWKENQGEFLPPKLHESEDARWLNQQ